MIYQCTVYAHSNVILRETVFLCKIEDTEPRIKFGKQQERRIIIIIVYLLRTKFHFRDRLCEGSYSKKKNLRCDVDTPKGPTKYKNGPISTDFEHKRRKD